MQSIEKLISYYDLQPHPEGGYFSENYRAENSISGEFFPQKFNKPHCSATSIYFLLKSHQKSHFHQLLSDEIWYYHSGDSILLHLFHSNGQYSTKILGPNFENDELFQIVIPQNTIFGAELLSHNGYSFVGCMVSPGFDFGDFKLIQKKEIIEKYSQFYEKVSHFF